jgi:glycine cleavage system pyridoxal-binding protein P
LSTLAEVFGEPLVFGGDHLGAVAVADDAEKVGSFLCGGRLPGEQGDAHRKDADQLADNHEYLS